LKSVRLASVRLATDTSSSEPLLTAEVSKAAFGLTPLEYAAHKGLKRQNLRDHMTDLELIFSMLGEAATTEITRTQDARGFPQSKTAASWRRNRGAKSSAGKIISTPPSRPSACVVHHNPWPRRTGPVRPTRPVIRRGSTGGAR
jgi:hypothetical protein